MNFARPPSGGMEYEALEYAHKAKNAAHDAPREDCTIAPFVLHLSFFLFVSIFLLRRGRRRRALRAHVVAYGGICELDSGGIVAFAEYFSKFIADFPLVAGRGFYEAAEFYAVRYVVRYSAE